MRIDNNVLNFTQGLRQTTQAQGSKSSNEDGVAWTGGDHVQLSGLAQTVGDDSPRVEQLAADYAAGRYGVTPQQVAASMVGEMMQR